MLALTRMCIFGFMGGGRAVWFGCGDDLDVERRRGREMVYRPKALGVLYSIIMVLLGQGDCNYGLRSSCIKVSCIER